MSSNITARRADTPEQALALLRELGALDDTHVAPTYGEYLSDTETTYDGYRNPDGSIPEDILYDAPATRTVS